MWVVDAMIAYSENLKTFKQHIENNEIVDRIIEKLGFNVGASEQRAFKVSLGEMYKVLNKTDLPSDVQIGIEYRIPITSRRIDFIVSGSDGENDNLVIVELKQWDRVTKTDMLGVIMLGNQEHIHPSWQAFSYASTIKHFNEAVEKNNIQLHPCAFLHDYKAKYLDHLVAPIYSDAISAAPVFIETDYDKLRNFIQKYIKYPSKKNLLYEIENGKIRPSKMLVDALANMLNNNEEYVLIDEQKIVLEKLYKLVTEKNKGRKRVIIVEGGAGTGKSVIAIDLLARLITKKGYTAFYVSKSSYVRENYYAKLTRNVNRYSYLRTLFKGSGSFIDSKQDEFDCLIVDEAHRLTARTKLGPFYRGENQVKEIIHASKNTVFFIDSKQQIDIKDIGSIEEIEKWADYYGAEVYKGDAFKLVSQFRCSGSDEYMAWVDSVLYNEPFEQSYTEVDYDIKVFDNILDMANEIKKINHNNKARIISGDVFPWISRNDKSQIDIHIYGFSAQWNKTKAFATDPKSIDEVGCIHTTQGMEFEYVGLIIGDDLRYVNGKIITDYTKHPPGATEFKRPYKHAILPEDGLIIDRLIRNTYRVLLTRGQKGCYIYCMDKNLSEYIKKRLQELKLKNNQN